MPLVVILTAIAMAMLASVTVSIGEETKGVFMVICLVSADVRSYIHRNTQFNLSSLTQWGKQRWKYLTSFSLMAVTLQRHIFLDIKTLDTMYQFVTTYQHKTCHVFRHVFRVTRSF